MIQCGTPALVFLVMSVFELGMDWLPFQRSAFGFNPVGSQNPHPGEKPWG